MKITRNSSEKLAYKVDLLAIKAFINGKSPLRIGEMVDGRVFTIVAATIAICLQAVSYNDIATAKNRIIAHHLTHNLVVQFHRGLLALHNNTGRRIAAKSNNICTLRLAINIYGILLDNLLELKATRREHILYYMATHPLFGRKYKPTTTHCIEDLGASIFRASSPKTNRRIVERWIVHKVSVVYCQIICIFAQRY